MPEAAIHEPSGDSGRKTWINATAMFARPAITQAQQKAVKSTSASGRARTGAAGHKHGGGEECARMAGCNETHGRESEDRNDGSVVASDARGLAGR